MPKFENTLKFRHLFRWHLYWNVFRFGWKTAIFYENLADNFDYWMQLSEDK